MPNYKRLFIPNTYLFLTIVTSQRQPILIENIELLRQAFRDTKKFYDFEIYASVILPDHMHLIIIPEKIEEYPKIIRAIKYNFSKALDGGVAIPPYVGASKLSTMAYNIAQGLNDDGIATPPYEKKQSRAGLPSRQIKSIWQKRYWEHTIRDDEDLNRHLDYIHYNPVKHDYTQKVKDWKFSSFDKFVEMKNYDIDWGSAKDVKHIETMQHD